MLAWGMFVFALDTTPYQEFQRQLAWRYPSTSRVGAMPAHQYLGRDDETIALSGVLLPEITGGRISLALLEELAEQGRAWPLIDGAGWYYGMFVATSLNATRSVFFRDGAARRIEFQLALTRVDETRTDLLGIIDSAVRGLL
jgi:hypothetical protein